MTSDGLAGNIELPRRDVAFISGAGRSGTTAVAYLLNQHPQLAIGIERYKYTFFKERNPQLDMFDRERFFTFEPDETNITPEASAQFAEQYEALEAKFDSVTVVGDKIPHLGNWYGRINHLFDDVRIVHMVREPVAVGRSWDRRAQNASDSNWSPTEGSQRGISRWMFENRKALAFRREHPDKILISSYEAFFSDDPAPLERTCEFLSVGPATNEQHAARLAGASRTAGKKFSDLGEQPDTVSDEQWERVVEMMGRLRHHLGQPANSQRHRRTTVEE